MGRTTSIEHIDGATTIASYDFAFDSGSRMTQMVTGALVGLSGTSDYSYDATDQIIEADHTHIADETYDFDINGNRSAGTSIGTGNQLLSDATWNYTYDDEGNLTVKARVSSDPADDKTVVYTWDHRNRLVSVTNKDNSGTVTQLVEHAYDVYDRRVSMTVDLDGAGPLLEQTTRYVYNGTNILATSDESGSVTQRMLHGPSVDQILAIEDVASGDVLWALADHLGSVRDVIDSDGTVENHLVYDSFGNVVSETDAAVDFLYGFTGRERDEASGLNYHRARYFDTNLGRWISRDPIRFEAGDHNLYRYVGNETTRFIDPSGLIQISDDEMMGGEGLAPQEQPIGVLKEVIVPEPKFFWDPGYKWKLPKPNIPGANGEQTPLGPAGGVDELEDWGKDILKENLVEPIKDAAKERAEKVVENIKGIFVKPKVNENEQLGPVRPKARPRFSFPKLFELDLKIRPKIHQGEGMSIQGGIELIPLLPQERKR